MSTYRLRSKSGSNALLNGRVVLPAKGPQRQGDFEQEDRSYKTSLVSFPSPLGTKQAHALMMRLKYENHSRMGGSSPHESVQMHLWSLRKSHPMSERTRHASRVVNATTVQWARLPSRLRPRRSLNDTSSGGGRRRGEVSSDMGDEVQRTAKSYFGIRRDVGRHSGRWFRPALDFAQRR